MYLDADGRVCAYEQYTYFVTKGESGNFPAYRFCSGDLYNEKPKKGKEHALQRIRQAFEPAIQARGRRMCWSAFLITTRFPSVRQSRWPGAAFLRVCRKGLQGAGESRLLP